jgi:hypothetical protein
MEVSPIQDGGESNLLEKIPEIESNHDDNGIPADVINKGESSSVSTGEPKLARITGLLKARQMMSTEASQGSEMSDDTTQPNVSRNVNFKTDESMSSVSSAFSSISNLVPMITRRSPMTSANLTPNNEKSAPTLSESELRKYVFQHTRAKRLVSGLRVHAFTRQAFVSSFTVGLAIGSVVAIILKLLKDVTCRAFFN